LDNVPVTTKIYVFNQKTNSKINSIVKESECVVLMINLLDRDTFLNVVEWIELIKECEYMYKIFIIGNAPLNTSEICTYEWEINDLLGKAKKKYFIDYEYSQINVNNKDETQNFINNKIINYCQIEAKKKLKNSDDGFTKGGCLLF